MTTALESLEDSVHAVSSPLLTRRPVDDVEPYRSFIHALWQSIFAERSARHELSEMERVPRLVEFFLNQVQQLVKSHGACV